MCGYRSVPTDVLVIKFYGVRKMLYIVTWWFKNAILALYNMCTAPYHILAGTAHNAFCRTTFSSLTNNIWLSLMHVNCVGHDWRLACQKAIHCLALVYEHFGSDLYIKSLTLQLDMLYDLVDDKRVESISGIVETAKNLHPVRRLYAELTKLLFLLMVMPLNI